jgi:LysM repeat protein
MMAIGCAQAPFGATGQESPARPATTPPAAPPAAATAEPAPPPDRPPPPTLSPQVVQRAVATAVEHLEAGDEASALVELERVLASEPGHRLAQSLMRQIKEDPQALLGRESFSYRIQPGETLSRISQRFLNDVFMFYALARYNDIKVPRLVAGGQTIRVPGKAPPPGAPAAPAPPATAAATKPPAAAAPPAAPPAASPAAAPASTPAAPAPPSTAAPPDPAIAQRERDAAILKHTRAARSALAKQDLDGAIRSWDAVLAIDPNNSTAQLERQRAIALKERLRRAQQ